MNDEPGVNCHCPQLPSPHSAHELELYRQRDRDIPALMWTDDAGENWNNGPWIEREYGDGSVTDLCAQWMQTAEGTLHYKTAVRLVRGVMSILRAQAVRS